MNRFLESLQALGKRRLIGIAIVAAAVLALIAGIALRGGSQPMALLYGDLELRDSAQVTAVLDKLHAPYEVKGGGAQILVPSDQVDRLRLALARDGLPLGGSVGYEIFDRGDSLTSSQFQQQINQLRALEGELARTIRSIRGVRNARVHLVLPKREPFARQQQEAQASVVLSMAGVQRMDNDEVQAILNLVASAVPGLKSENVSIVDNRGRLLARSGHPSDQDINLRNNDQIRHTIERRLGMAVEDMLERTLGPGHVRAEASVEMDFDRLKETKEQYDPDGQVVRSQQTTNDASKNTEAQQNVTVQNNLPNPGTADGGTNGSAQNHQEENTSYEIGKTVRMVVRDTPQIKKISMAVLVDGTTARGPDGKPIWHELSQADLDRISTLVKSAVGYDEKRGDRIDVVNMRFAPMGEIADAEPEGFLGLQLGNADLIRLVTVGLLAIVALFALAFVVRPLALKLVAGMPPATLALEGPATGATDLLPTQMADPNMAPLPNGTAAIEADVEAGDTMLNVPNISGQMRASSMRQLNQLAQTQPEAAVTVIRNWLVRKAN